MADEKNVEYVVLTDTLTYKHPDSNPAPGQPPAIVVANRGDRLFTAESDDPLALPHISTKEAQRAEALGAITKEKDGLGARLALAGQRPDPRLGGTPYASLTSPVEQRQAAVAIAQMAGGSGPQSSKADLQRLSIGDLQRLAMAFGATEDVFLSDSKDDIIGWLKGEGDDAESAEDTKAQNEARDAAQNAARVLPSHDDTSLGDKVTAEHEAAAKPRRKSAADKSDSK